MRVACFLWPIVSAYQCVRRQVKVSKSRFIVRTREALVVLMSGSLAGDIEDHDNRHGFVLMIIDMKPQDALSESERLPVKVAEDDREATSANLIPAGTTYRQFVACTSYQHNKTYTFLHLVARQHSVTIIPKASTMVATTAQRYLPPH